MVAGRPPLDKKKIAEDFLVWAKDNPEALTVPQFAVQHGIYSGTMIRWCNEDPEFKESYMRAKEYIGNNRLKSSMIVEKDKPKLDTNVYLKTLANYDTDYNHHVREEKAYDASLKVEPENQGTILNVNLSNESAAYIARQISAQGLPEGSPQCPK